MKRGPYILLIAIALGSTLFCARFMLRERAAHGETAGAPQERESLLPELAWLRTKLQLKDDQFEKVKALHLAYRPKCQGFCMRVQDSEAALLAAMKNAQADLTAILRARAELQIECQQAMIAHIRQTAACMDPPQAQRYFDLIQPYLFGMTPAP